MIGPCEYITCRSMIGTQFRAVFSFMQGSRQFEVLLCPEHTRLMSMLKEDHPNQLCRTQEGWVYPRMWLDAMGFVS